MDKKANHLFKKMMSACDVFHAHPIVLYARGTTGNNRDVLMMLAGPTLTLESLAKLRSEITECLDAKEKDLKGQSGSDTAHIYY